MQKIINFDLDGTLYNLYSMENWLSRIEQEEKNVFTDGEFITNYDEFIECIDLLKERGYKFNVITWLPMGASKAYEKQCTEEKLKWIEKYLPFVEKIKITPYGKEKHKQIKQGVLIDDNKVVCSMWNGSNRKAINVSEKFNVVKALRKIIGDTDEVQA